jgi:hypothetical protein
VLRAAGGTETLRENNQNWLELDEGDPGFQLLTKEEIFVVIFFYLFSPPLSILSRVWVTEKLVWIGNWIY